MYVVWSIEKKIKLYVGIIYIIKDCDLVIIIGFINLVFFFRFFFDVLLCGMFVIMKKGCLNL